MTTVTASELQKNFGRYQAHAQREAVKVTSHGRESVVLISAEDYERFKSMDDRIAMHPADLPDDLANALQQTIDDLANVEPLKMNKISPA